MQVGWPSGSGSGLQNRLRRFESGTDLHKVLQHFPPLDRVLPIVHINDVLSALTIVLNAEDRACCSFIGKEVVSHKL